MFEPLAMAEPDKILALMNVFCLDDRADKLDLGVGVYRDSTGATPVMRAVAEAERRLVAALVLGPAIERGRMRALQTPGGSGALRVLMDLLRLANPEATLWLSEPTWPNHMQIAAAVGLKIARYPYVDAAGALRFDAMLDAICKAARGDVVLLHGSCHNPTGIHLSAPHRDALQEAFARNGAFPLVDRAYQGFGDGLEEDAAGARVLASSLPEAAIAVSCSKNFGVYRDRVGAAILSAADLGRVEAALSQMAAIARTLYSMPPHYGAARVAKVLSEADLRADWNAELDGMRARMRSLRIGLTAALRRFTNSERFDRVADSKGMFARLDLSPTQIERMRREHGVYIVGDGRINLAGLREDGLDLAALIQ
jgi:aspartate aminotransferase